MRWEGIVEVWRIIIIIISISIIESGTTHTHTPHHPHTANRAVSHPEQRISPASPPNETTSNNPFHISTQPSSITTPHACQAGSRTTGRRPDRDCNGRRRLRDRDGVEQGETETHRLEAEGPAEATDVFLPLALDDAFDGAGSSWTESRVRFLDEVEARAAVGSEASERLGREARRVWERVVRVVESVALGVVIEWRGSDGFACWDMLLWWVGRLRTGTAWVDGGSRG